MSFDAISLVIDTHGRNWIAKDLVDHRLLSLGIFTVELLESVGHGGHLRLA